MAIQRTVGRYSEHWSAGIRNNNMPAVVDSPSAVRPPAVVYEQIRIGMPRSLLKSLKILAKSKRVGVTEILLDVFRCIRISIWISTATTEAAVATVGVAAIQQSVLPRRYSSFGRYR
jgi:hypothetical protein